MNTRNEIKKWLIDKGLTQAHIAREVGVSRTLVSLVIKGELRSVKVIDALIRHGCQAELLTKKAA